MITLKYHSGYETGDNLLECINSISSGSAKRKANLKYSSRDLLVRWGDTSHSEIEEFYGKVLNKSMYISHNTNKLRSLEILKKRGLSVPNVHLSKNDITTFPVLGRDRNHHGGLDIVIIEGNNYGRNDISKIPTKDFYTQYIESSVEYRVHVFAGEIIRTTKKVFRGHDKDGNVVVNKDIIKNDTYGWGHSNISIESFKKEYADVSIAAIEAIKLDFGAVDLLIDKKGKPFILEVNTCPRLNTVGLDLYASAILDYYDSEIWNKKTFSHTNKQEKKKEILIRW